MDESFNHTQLLVATGCSLNHSWMGGFSCHQSLFPDLSLPDYKWIGAGGFGGGGGSCKGGGGGGGFIGMSKILVLLTCKSKTQKHIPFYLLFLKYSTFQ